MILSLLVAAMLDAVVRVVLHFACFLHDWYGWLVAGAEFGGGEDTISAIMLQGGHACIRWAGLVVVSCNL